MKLAVLSVLTVVLTACSAQRSSLDDYGLVPDFTLTAQDGQPFHSSALAGKVWVADFIYTTCPGPCPRMTSQMHDVQTAILKMPDVKLVSFTVDPATDTPPVLAQYAKVHGALAAHWYFLTGPVATLQKLDRDAFKLGNVDGTLQHSTRFVLVDRQSHIRGYYETSDPGSIPHVIADVRALAREQS
jgi:protein SCO1